MYIFIKNIENKICDPKISVSKRPTLQIVYMFLSKLYWIVVASPRKSIPTTGISTSRSTSKS